MVPWYNIAIVALIIFLVVLGGDILYYKPKPLPTPHHPLPSKVRNLTYISGSIKWEDPIYGGPDFKYEYNIKDSSGKIVQEGNNSTKDGDYNIVLILSSVKGAQTYTFNIIPSNDIGNGPKTTLSFHIWKLPKILNIRPLQGDSIFVEDGVGHYKVQIMVETADIVSLPLSSGLIGNLEISGKLYPPSSLKTLDQKKYAVEWNSPETRISPNTVITITLTTKNNAGEQIAHITKTSPYHKPPPTIKPGLISDLQVIY